MKHLVGLTSAALLAGSLLVAAPAVAANPALTVTYSALDTSTPGHVTGTVTSDQPYVWVRLAGNVPATKLTLAGGTAGFDLETWGYGDSSDGKARVQGVACPADPPTEASCSEVIDSPRFFPHEVTPEITWFADDTIGPGQTPSITVADTGGGTLQAIFVSDGDGGYANLDHNGTTPLPVQDGVGYVHITRCSTANPYNCSDMNFSTELHHDLAVHRTMTAEATGSLVTGTTMSTTFDVTTSRTGTYSLTWHLQGYDDDNGTLIPGTEGPTHNVTGTLTNGVADDVPVDLTGLADGKYVPVGTITVTDPDFGTYSNVGVAAGGVFTIDRTPPDVTTITPSAATIYPLIKTEKRPGTSTVTVTGNLEYQDTAEIRNGTGAAIAHPTLDFTSQNKATLVWDGTDDGGTPQAAGTYTVVVLDLWGNPSTKVATVAVSDKHLVTKTFKRTVTARASLVGQFVGRCSQLRKPSLRGWTGSLGYYANTRCRTTTWKASGVVTEHGIVLPAADRYLDVRVDTYGGAARSTSRSTAGISYLTTGGTWVNNRLLTKGLGWHAGVTRSGAGVVFPDRSFGWAVAVGPRNRYDVARFTIVLRYETLG